MADMTKVWLGLGIESAGTILFGMDSKVVWLVNLGDPLDKVRYAQLTEEGARVGLWLGGSGGLVAVLGWGFATPNQMNGASFGWDFAFSPGVKVGKYLKSLKDVKHLQHLGKFVAKSGGVIGKGTELAEEYAKLKTAGEQLVKNRNAILEGDKPQLVALPVPLANYGIEVGVGKRGSETKINSWGTMRFQ